MIYLFPTIHVFRIVCQSFYPGKSLPLKSASDVFLKWELGGFCSQVQGFACRRGVCLQGVGSASQEGSASGGGSLPLETSALKIFPTPSTNIYRWPLQQSVVILLECILIFLSKFTLLFSFSDPGPS